MKQKKQKGFTLIEMMIVVAIIGLLATIVIVVVAGARKKANATTAKAHMAQISKALDLYSANGCTTGAADIALKYGDSIEGDGACGNEVFMQKIPSPPSGSMSYHTCTGPNPADLGQGFEKARVDAGDYCIAATGFEDNAVFTCINGSCSCSLPGQMGCVESK